MKLVALKSFSWAHAGVRIEHFEKGQPIETDDNDLIKVAIEEKWVKSESKSSKEEGKKDPEALSEGDGNDGKETEQG